VQGLSGVRRRRATFGFLRKGLRAKSRAGQWVQRARSSAVEHLTFNQVVVGSIPTGLTIGFAIEFFDNVRAGTGTPTARPRTRPTFEGWA
jgi:hypothetical protein